jgi:urease accessory protein
MTELNALVGLLRLVSPALPIGAFAYSRGLEHAVSAGWVHDEKSAEGWIVGLLEHSLCNLDGPLLVRIERALRAHDVCDALHWIEISRASRESRELLLEDDQMGRALLKLLADLDVPHAKGLLATLSHSLVAGFAVAGLHHGVAIRDLVAGLFYAACESQTGAAVRLIPLGQTSGQRILSSVLRAIPACVEHALEVLDDDIGNLAPALAMGSAWHETQYSRLFRS